MSKKMKIDIFVFLSDGKAVGYKLLDHIAQLKSWSVKNGENLGGCLCRLSGLVQQCI
jgi:hypothetical protein